MDQTLLTTEDLDTLIEAVQAWEVFEEQAKLTMDLLSVIFSPSPEAARKAAEEMRTRSMARPRTSVRQERSVLLRAKIIQLKQSAAAEQVLTEASNVDDAALDAMKAKIRSTLADT